MTKFTDEYQEEKIFGCIDTNVKANYLKGKIQKLIIKINLFQ